MKNISELQADFGVYIQQNKFTKAPEALYEPINYIMSLGGKRIRPVLLLLAYNLYKEDLEKAMPAAYGIELFHNFTLLHDDIMDEADVRRGQPTVHRKFGVNAGILSGDAMLIYVYDCLMRLGCKEKLPELIQIFNKMGIEVCEGQQYDMNFEEQQNVSISDYIKMIELKTAVLLGTSLQMGAIIADANSHCSKNLYNFGRNIGIAFQLQDDILDTYGDPDVFGKKIGGDIVQNKKTFLVLKTMELATESDSQTLWEWMGKTTVQEEQKIEAVRALFDQYNVRQHAEKLKENYLQDAFQALDLVDCLESRKANLRMLANQLMLRKV